MIVYIIFSIVNISAAIVITINKIMPIGNSTTPQLIVIIPAIFSIASRSVKNKEILINVMLFQVVFYCFQYFSTKCFHLFRCVVFVSSYLEGFPKIVKCEIQYV